MAQNYLKFLCVFASGVALLGCQGAYNTSTSSPNPVLNQRAEMEKPLVIKPISSGGIIMKRSYDPEWEMPKREVDQLRNQFESLQKELLAMQSGQEQKISQKFMDVENRVRQMRMEEMKQAAQDAELMALVKSKFDTIDRNISFLKASEAQQASEKRNLLESLNDKFQAVDTRLSELNEKDNIQNQAHKEEIRTALNELSTLKSSFNQVEQKTADISKNIEAVKYEQETQKKLDEARKQAVQEERELRLMEEFELRRKMEDTRREEITALIEQTEQEKRKFMSEGLERQKKQASLEFKLVEMREQLKILEEQEARRLAESEERALVMKKDLEKRLNAIRENYDLQFTELEREKTLLDSDLDSADENTREKLKERRQQLNDSIEELQLKQSNAIKEAEEYRHAIEQRVFAMGRLANQEAPDSEKLAVNRTNSGRIIESGIKVSNIEMTASDEGGVIGGYPQQDWIDLEDYQVVLHENNSRLDRLMETLLTRAEPYVGPWQIKWKLKSENMDVVAERFSLDVETDFDAFTSYLSNYMKSYRGFGLTFNIFRAERVLVVTDS